MRDMLYHQDDTGGNANRSTLLEDGEQSIAASPPVNVRNDNNSSMRAKSCAMFTISADNGMEEEEGSCSKRLRKFTYAHFDKGKQPFVNPERNSGVLAE